MVPFAIWAGKLCAALSLFGAVLALFMAQPPGDAERYRMQAECRAAAGPGLSGFTACSQIGTGWDAALTMAAMQMGGAALFLLLLTALLQAAASAAASLAVLRRQAEAAEAGRQQAEATAARRARIAEAAGVLARQYPSWDTEHGEALAGIARERLAEARVDGRAMRTEDALAYARHELRRRGQG
jgi:hypothetical protein